MLDQIDPIIYANANKIVILEYIFFYLFFEFLIQLSSREKEEKNTGN